MVSTQGEIRVGPGHQARLPDYRPGLTDVEIPPDPEFSKDREEIKWVPAQTLDGDLLMFLRAARSMAAFAGMCDGGSPDDGCIAASKDDTTINALDTLHASGYDPGKALQALVKCPMPKGIEKKWSEEEIKRFVKGLRQFGKNFFRIRKDLLPHKDTPELVEFYYLWKKTPGANNNRPHRRNRRQGSLRRIRNTRNTRGQPKEEKEGQTSARPSPNPKEGGEGSSGSDDDNSEDDSDSREQTYRCNHCYSANSRDVQQSGKDRQMLCGDCRAHFKKHGELPPLPVGGKPGETYLFRPVQSESPDSSPGRMRTRGKTKEQTTPGSRSRPKRGNGTNTPDNEVDKEKKPPKSPALHGSPGDKKSKNNTKDTPTKSRKRNQTESEDRSTDAEREMPSKKKKNNSNSNSTSNSNDDLENNDESNDNFEEKPAKMEEEKEDPLEKVEEMILVKAEVNNLEEKVMEVDPLKICPLPASPVAVAVMVANTVVPETVPPAEPEEEPPKPPPPPPLPPMTPEEPEKVLIIDPKTGFIGSGSTPPPPPLPPPLQPPILNIPTKVIVEDSKPIEAISQPPILVATPTLVPQSTSIPASKGMTIIVPQPTFLNQPKLSPGAKLPLKPVLQDPLSIKVEPRDDEPKFERIVEPEADKPFNFTVAKLQEEAQDSEDQVRQLKPVEELGLVKDPPLEPPTLVPSIPLLPPRRDVKDLPGMHPGLIMPPHLSMPPHMTHFSFPFNTQPRSFAPEQPQNLKIKQELQMGESFDPLQNLKDLKVPGHNDRLPGPSIDNIKKEPEQKLSPPEPSVTPRSEREKERSVTPAERDVKPLPPEEPSHTPPLPPRPRSSLPTPPTTSAPGSSSPFVALPASSGGSFAASAVPPRPSSSSKSRESHHSHGQSLVSPSHLPGSSHVIQPCPTSIPGPVMHPSQQPSPLSRISPAHHPAFLPPHIPPHHPLVQHTLPLFAAMHNPYHPYAAYPFPYPYPYPIPPPQLKETTMTHHSSSSVTTRVRETDRIDAMDGDVGSTETTMLHHASVHHSHSSSDKQQGIHISHSTTSSSTASLKKQSSATRVSSPVAHMSATMSQTQSTSISLGGNNHHHSHHHSHHHQSGDVMMGSNASRVKPHHGMMAIPPIHPMASMGLPPPTMPGSSLEALRAHAVAAANMQQSPAHGGSHHTSRHSSVDEVKSEPTPDPVEPAPEEDEGHSPQHIPRGPSPEPKIEDSECHRSQSAIFLRHWNRGDYNSCTRTDLTFKPVPESKLARKREERLRKQAEKEREEREKAQQQAQSQRKVASTPENKEAVSKPPSRGPIETISSPYDRFAQRGGYPDTPALRQLSEYARPHAGFSPGRAGSLGCLDMIQYQFNSMYGPRDRLELEHLEREKREREMRELRERELSDRLKEEMIKNNGAPPGTRMPTQLDAHWMELHRRYGGPPPQFGLYPSPGHPGKHPLIQGGSLGGTRIPTQLDAYWMELHRRYGEPPPQFGLYPSPGHPGAPSLSQLERERLERLGIPQVPQNGPPGSGGPSQGHQHAALEAAERLALATDPMVRLQMAGISPEYHAHTHAHSHTHAHTHLHLHPSQQAQAQQEAAAAAAGFPLPASAPPGYPRPNLMPPREMALGLHHPADLLGRPYADQLAQQAAAHEQLQRQLLMERERFPHPSLVAQHDEYMRAQRERELKVRALEDAARGGPRS